MTKMNNTIKFIMLNLNIVFAAIGGTLFGFSFYLWFGKWGNLQKGFFLSSGIIVCLCGIAVTLATCLGCQGIDNQTKKYGFWTGRKVLTIYLILLAASLVGEMFLLDVSLINVQQFQDTINIMDTTPNMYPSLTGIEPIIQDKFNSFFFGAASGCDSTLYSWFWSWVNSNCPTSIEQLNCQKCYSYSITFCQANQNTCDNSNLNPNYACPYAICRNGILSYFVSKTRILAYSIFGLVALQVIMIVLNIMLICYNQRDSVERILYKSGIKRTNDTIFSVDRIDL